MAEHNQSKTNLIHKEIKKDKRFIELANRVNAINLERLSLEHTLMNMLKLSGHKDIEWSDVNWALSYYVPNQNENTQSQSEVTNQQPPLKEIRSITLLKAKKLVCEILKEKSAIESSTIMVQEFFNKEFRINQNTLKYLLNQMKKEEIINNDKSRGGWYLIDNKS